MSVSPETSLPASWIERHVNYTLAQHQLLSGLAEEMVVDGYETADLFHGDEEVLSLSDLKERFGSVIVPSQSDIELDDKKRLVCVFVLGILGRWDEAFGYMGEFPGAFDRHNEDLFGDRIDILMALSEHGRHADVVTHGAQLAFDCQAVLGDAPLAVIVNTLRAESLLRVGEREDALQLFCLVRDQIEQRGYIVNDFLMASIEEHFEYLVFSSAK